MYQLTSADSGDLVGLPPEDGVFDDQYRIEGLLGVSEVAIVLAATHIRHGRAVALKLLRPQWADHPQLVERLRNEGRASAALRSEHVARVFHVGVALGRPYLAMERLDGEDFATLLAESDPVPIASAVDLLLQACEAIADAHASGIVHCNLTPTNLLLTSRADRSPCVKVLDFGLSKVIGAPGLRSGYDRAAPLPGALMGSPHYMSPEQMRSAQDVDARSDIWSLGAILYELVSGEAAFQGATIADLCSHVFCQPPRSLAGLRIDASPEFEEVILRCLEKDRSHRYASVAELARALSPFGTQEACTSERRIARMVEGGIESRSPAVLFAKAAPPKAPTAPIAARTMPRVSMSRYAAGAVGILLAAGVVWANIEFVRSEGLGKVDETTSAAASLPEPTSVTRTTSATRRVTRPDPSATPPAREPLRQGAPPPDDRKR